MAAHSSTLTPQAIAAYDAAFRADPRFQLAANALARTDVVDVYMKEDRLKQINHVYSNKVSIEGKVTSQKSTGRCWMFAGLNVLRLSMMAKYNLGEDFELSQSHLLFWDKLEKANYYLETVISTRNEPVGSRLFDFVNTAPLQDGGQWDMFVNLVNKYGVVPQSVAQECFSSSNTERLRRFLTNKLREYCARLREIASKFGSDFAGVAAAGSALRDAKDEMMTEVYRILCIHLGRPVSTFEWVYAAKDKSVHRVLDLTPQTFFRDHVAVNLDDFVSLVNDPRHEYGSMLTVEHLGNVWGGLPVRYLNLDVNELKAYAAASISANEAVWFGCEVSQRLHKTLGIMDTGLFDYAGLYGTADGMTKAQRLQYGESAMTHAMVLTGFDAYTTVWKDSDGADVALTRPITKWRVENSWGKDYGDSGYFLMTTEWFDEYVFQIVVSKRFLSADHVSALTKTPTVLPMWDPMGTLAGDLSDETAAAMANLSSPSPDDNQ